MKSVFIGFCFLACFLQGTVGEPSPIADLIAAIMAAFEAANQTPTTTTTTTTEPPTTAPFQGITIKPFTGPAMQLMPGKNMTVVVDCSRFCRKRRNGNFRIRRCANRRDQNLCVFCRLALDCLSNGVPVFS